MYATICYLWEHKTIFLDKIQKPEFMCPEKCDLNNSWETLPAFWTFIAVTWLQLPLEVGWNWGLDQLNHTVCYAIFPY